MVLIRRADARDEPAIIRVWSDHAAYQRSLERAWPRRWSVTEPFERTYARLLAPVWSDPKQAIFIAEDGSQPVGFVHAALVEPDPSPARIETLVVAASQRGTDIGQALMSAALAWCVEGEADEVVLDVIAADTAAVRLYEQQGFHRALTAYYRPAVTAGAVGRAPVAELRPAPGMVRRAGAADEVAVLRMWDAVRRFHRELEPHWPRQWANPPPDILSWLAQELQSYWNDTGRKVIFVCDTGQELVGFIRVALMDLWLSPGQVESLYVREDQRGQGVGQVLMARALGWCAAHGAEEVGLHVSASNAGAARFYERLGFRPFLSTYFRALPAAGSGGGESTATD